jgi:hypothetical protein
LPKRIRSHVGLIGDAGQAKTQLLYQIVDLVPGSRVESMQSGTPVFQAQKQNSETKNTRYSTSSANVVSRVASDILSAATNANDIKLQKVTSDKITYIH